MNQTNSPAGKTKATGDWPGQKVISLIRVSTAEQAGDWKSGVTRQRESNELAEKIVGLPIAHEVCAIDVSGRHVREDPQFLKLFADLKRPEVAGIYVAEHSRLFRPEFGADYAIIDEFAKAKKKIWVRGQMIDPCTNEGNMSLVINGLMSGQELKLIKQRMTDGRNKARQQGRLGQGAHTLPKGVTYVKERDADGKLTWRYGLEPDAAATVKRAFEMLLEGYSYDQIATATKRARGALCRTLSNPIWIGKRQYIYRASDKEYYRPNSDKRYRRSVLRDDPYEVAIDIPHLISDEMYTEAQAIILERRTHWRKAKVKNADRERPLLRGIGRCTCGAALCYMIATRNPKNDRYNCTTRHNKKREYCGAESASCRAVDDKVREMVRNLGNPEFIRSNSEQVVAKAAADPGKAARVRALKSLATQRENLLDMRQEGAITKQQYTERLRRVEDKRRELEAQTPVLPATVTPEQVAAMLAEAFADFNLAPLDRQRDMLMRTFKDITIDPAGGGVVRSVTIKPRFHEQSGVVNSSLSSRIQDRKNYTFPSDIRLTLAVLAKAS